MKSLTHRILDITQDYAREILDSEAKEYILFLRSKIEEVIDEADFDEVALTVCEHFLKHDYKYHGSYKAIITDSSYELLNTVISKKDL